MVILENIDIDKVSNRFKFGISNRATTRSGRLSNAESGWNLGALTQFGQAHFVLFFIQIHTNTRNNLHKYNLDSCEKGEDKTFQTHRHTLNGVSLYSYITIILIKFCKSRTIIRRSRSQVVCKPQHPDTCSKKQLCLLFFLNFFANK